MALGRPRLDADTKRVLLGAYVSPSMRDKLEAKARAAGFPSLSAFLRERVLAPVVAEREGAGK